MRNENKIRLVTDECAAENLPAADGAAESEPDPLGAFDPGGIDALLRQTADEMTAKVDFESIRNRALAAAKAKKAKRGRWRRAFGAAMVAAASVLFAFSLVSIIKPFSSPKTGDVTALNSAQPDRSGLDAVNSDRPSGDFRRIEAGTVTEFRDPDADPVPAEELLPENLPDGMTTLIDEDSTRVCAMGLDTEGGEVSYVCSLETDAPIELALGEAGSIGEDGELTYYWQIAEGRYLSVRFTGFGQGEADSMFASLSRRIAPNPEETAPAAGDATGSAQNDSPQN